MKVLHAFNMANDNYFVVKALRQLGIDAHLLLQKPSHVASLPQWEEADVDTQRLGDVYAPNWEAFSGWQLPDWVHVWNASKSWYPLSRSFRWLALLPMIARHDLVVGQTPFAKIAPIYKLLIRKPYAIYDAGLIRYLHDKTQAMGMARSGYRGAAVILFTNTDTEDMLREYNAVLEYTPFAIDTTLYSPDHNHDPEVMTFFHPARHIWKEKGNDKLLRAFARYSRRNQTARLIMVDWHQSNVDDIARSKRLINDLNMGSRITWLPLMSKKQLRYCYANATAICDQFTFGALGTTSPEGLSCGKPVIAYVRNDLWTKYHESAPPVLNAFTEDEIYQAMCDVEVADVRKQYGCRGRDWILHNCEMRLVAEQQLAIYKKVLNK